MDKLLSNTPRGNQTYTHQCDFCCCLYDTISLIEILCWPEPPSYCGAACLEDGSRQLVWSRLWWMENTFIHHGMIFSSVAFASSGYAICRSHQKPDCCNVQNLVWQSWITCRSISSSFSLSTGKAAEPILEMFDPWESIGNTEIYCHTFRISQHPLELISAPQVKKHWSSMMLSEVLKQLALHLWETGVTSLLNLNWNKSRPS